MQARPGGVGGLDFSPNAPLPIPPPCLVFLQLCLGFSICRVRRSNWNLVWTLVQPWCQGTSL